jgi:glutamine synthetase
MSRASDFGSALDGVVWVRLTFVDVFGTSNSVQLPAHRFAQAVSEGEPFDGSALQGRSRALEADMRLRPDASTLHRVGSVARVACTVLTPGGAPWPADPRTALVALVEDSLAELAESWQAAAELEFYLLDRGGSGDPEPIDRAAYFDDVEGIGTAVVRTAAERLISYGIDVTACHHEAGPGQYELDLGPLGPLELADALVLAKQTVQEAAVEEGVTATFMARPFNNQPGSGLHIHQRVAGLVEEGSGTLTADGAPFVAGQLAHARALAALASPTVNSFKRLHSGPEAPGAAVWAHVNRAALIRIAEGAIEFRGADPSANPYLLVAGLLVAAADGMSSGLELGPPVEEAAGTFDPADTTEVRYQPLPRNLDEALDALMGDDAFVDAFDARLLAHLVDGRRAEAESYRSYVTHWELDRYLDES